MYILFVDYSDLLKIGDAMGDKMGMFLQWITIFIAGYVMALVQGWKLALAVMSISPLLIFASGFVGRVRQFKAVLHTSQFINLFICLVF